MNKLTTSYCVANNIIVTLILSLLPSFACAFFCPTNFNQINFGDSIEQVRQQCGEPISKNETKNENNNTPQQWSYYIPQNVSTSLYNNQMQGTLKTEITFDDKGKAININVNGIAVGATTICGNNIQLGDGKEAVKSACGNPAFINEQAPPTKNLSATQDSTQKITTFIYNTTPPVKLIFDNGKLSDKQ